MLITMMTIYSNNGPSIACVGTSLRCRGWCSNLGGTAGMNCTSATGFIYQVRRGGNYQPSSGFANLVLWSDLSPYHKLNLNYSLMHFKTYEEHDPHATHNNDTHSREWMAIKSESLIFNSTISRRQSVIDNSSATNNPNHGRTSREEGGKIESTRRQGRQLESTNQRESSFSSGLDIREALKKCIALGTHSYESSLAPPRRPLNPFSTTRSHPYEGFDRLRTYDGCSGPSGAPSKPSGTEQKPVSIDMVREDPLTMTQEFYLGYCSKVFMRI
eukprot:GHVH01004602.1.p1 GENE.GHVH01004602.1~~GHVH01004602.1.p1  ORF type:complete len:272 (+),score=18.47 GHVH01004602.1:70-885(+)